MSLPFLGDRFRASRKGFIGEGGWVHPASLGCSVTGWDVSFLLRMMGLENSPLTLEGLNINYSNEGLFAAWTGGY